MVQLISIEIPTPPSLLTLFATLFIKVLLLEKMIKKEAIMYQKEQLLYSSLRNKLT